MLPHRNYSIILQGQLELASLRRVIFPFDALMLLLYSRRISKELNDLLGAHTDLDLAEVLRPATGCDLLLRCYSRGLDTLTGGWGWAGNGCGSRGYCRRTNRTLLRLLLTVA